MYCIVCGCRIPEGAQVCPQCGTFITASNTETNISSSSNPTIAPSPYYQGGQSGTPSAYGVDPYNTPPIPPTSKAMTSSPMYNPYHTPNASPHFNTTEQIPPPPPRITAPSPQPRKSRAGLLIGLAALVVLVLGGGGLLLLAKQNPAGPTQAQLNATATVKSERATMATATAVQAAADKNPYAPGTGTLLLNDTLRDNSKGYKWDEATMYGNNNNGGTSVCGFKNSAYHVTRQQMGALLCSPEAPNLIFSNLAFEANLNLIQGDYPGIIIRLNQAQGTGYLFDIDIQGHYGIFLMNLNAKNNQDEYKSLHSGTNIAIKKGLQQSNLLAVVANGDTISMYINNQYIDSIHDKTYSSGQIGLYVYGTKASDLMVSSARAWKL
jgi:eukaryotic-like serine/threonine-protein kinase